MDILNFTHYFYKKIKNSILIDNILLYPLRPHLSHTLIYPVFQSIHLQQCAYFSIVIRMHFASVAKLKRNRVNQQFDCSHIPSPT